MTWRPWFAWRPVQTLGGHWAFLKRVERRWNSDINWWDFGGYSGADGGFEYRLPLVARGV